MPRPMKLRTVCCMPNTHEFGPSDYLSKDVVILSIDQYETIRIIDFEGLTQEDCALQMQVARTTVQGIYEEARKIIADAIVNGKILRIEGGSYKLCEEDNRQCKNCCKNSRMHHNRGE